MTHRQARGDLGVAHPETGQVFSDRCVEFEHPRFDQAHRGGGDEGLGVRAYLEKCLLVNRQRIARAGDAEARAKLAPFAVNADGDARHAEPSHRFGHALANLLEDCFAVHR
jgi:hypothetical protein